MYKGESAGASSVAYHLMYPGSWPYFRNGIIQSVYASINEIVLIVLINTGVYKVSEFWAGSG